MKKYVFIQFAADDAGVNKLEEDVNKTVAQGYSILAAYGISTAAQAVNCVWLVKEFTK